MNPVSTTKLWLIVSPSMSVISEIDVMRPRGVGQTRNLDDVVLTVEVIKAEIFPSLQVVKVLAKSERLLIRGETSVGLAAAAIAKRRGAS